MNCYSHTRNRMKMRPSKSGKTYDDKKSNGSDKLIAFEGRMPEVILSKDTLRGSKACVENHISKISLQRFNMEYGPQVAIEIADVAAKHIHAALPRSRGGILLCSSVGSSAPSSAGDRSDTEPILHECGTWKLEKDVV
jgi:hypothetical protein